MKVSSSKLKKLRKKIINCSGAREQQVADSWLSYPTLASISSYTDMQSDLMLRTVRTPCADSWSTPEDRFEFLVEFYPILI